MLYLSHNPTTRTSRGIYTAPFGYLNRLIIRMSALVANVRSPALMASEMMAEKTEVKQTDRQTDRRSLLYAFHNGHDQHNNNKLVQYSERKVENVDRSPNIPFSLHR